MPFSLFKKDKSEKIFKKGKKDKSEKSNVNGYTIGVSSGMFGAAQRGEAISYIDLSQKGFYGALKGVNFTQIDMETSTELDSPDIDNRLEKIRNLGISYGFHGETPAMGGAQIALTAAIENQYKTGHTRFIENLEGSGRLKAVYYLQHSCEGPPAETPYIRLGESMQPTSVVDIWGRRLDIFLSKKENEHVLNWVIRDKEILELIGRYPYELSYESCVSEYQRSQMDKMRYFQQRELTEEEKEEAKKQGEKEAIKHLKEMILDFSKRSDMRFGAEKIPYLIIGKWMSDKKDPIWVGIVGNEKFESVKENPPDWVPAVAAKYIWGHLNPLPSMENRFKDPKKILEKYNFDFVIETPMVSKGMEREYRVTRPKHFVILCKNSGTKHCGAVIDFEHILGADINPKKEIEDMDSDGGKYVKALHVGWPTPLQPAHIPIYLGSEQQEWLYEWMLALRKKGFNESENRYIIFERAGPLPHPEVSNQQDPVLQSTLALRKIIEYLRAETTVNELPNDFYGIDDKEEKMQNSRMKEHALDPIRGMLTTPEGGHSYLGEAAKGKGKIKEWESGEKYR